MWRTGILVQTRNSLRNITERCVCIKDIRCLRERSWWPGECFHIESNREQLFSSLAFLPLTGREGPKHQMYFVEDSFPPPGRKGLQGRQRWWRVHQPAWEQRYWAAWEKAGRQNPNAQESSNIYTADSDTLRGLRPAGLSLWDLMLGLHRSNSFHPLDSFGTWISVSRGQHVIPSTALLGRSMAGTVHYLGQSLLGNAPRERMGVWLLSYPQGEFSDASWQGSSMSGCRWRIKFCYCLAPGPSWCPEDFAF